jgi:hypothetical protein
MTTDLEQLTVARVTNKTSAFYQKIQYHIHKNRVHYSEPREACIHPDIIILMIRFNIILPSKYLEITLSARRPD